MSTRTRKDWILWAQLGCALVVTFHAEYTLALAAGVHPWVALAVPGALDLYVIRALQKHRDVFLAVLVMVAANVASHLVTAGLIPVGWAVYSAVGGTVPLLLWRGHSLRHTRTRKELLWGVPAGAVSAPEDDDPIGYLPVPPPVPESDPEPLYVPEVWKRKHLKVVPDPPPEAPTFDPVPALYSSVLMDSDWPYLERAAEYVHQVRDENRTPTVRGLKSHLSVGQERAKRLLQHLEGEAK